MNARYLKRRVPTRFVRLTGNELAMAQRVGARAAAMVLARDANKKRPRNYLDAITTQTEAAGLAYHSQQYYLICRRALEIMIELTNDRSEAA